MNEPQVMEELIEELIKEEKPQRKKKTARGFGDPEAKAEPLPVEEEELVEEAQHPEPQPEEPKAPEARHHEYPIRPMTRRKPVPQRGLKAAVRVRP